MVGSWEAQLDNKQEGDIEWVTHYGTDGKTRVSISGARIQGPDAN